MRKVKTVALFLCIALMCALLPSFGLAEDKTPSPIPVIAEDDITPTPAGIHHYMLICMDSWNTDIEALTNSDGLVLVTVDEFEGRIMLTSFIRDMLIRRWDGKFGRINNITYLYQPELKAAGEKDTARKVIEELVYTLNTHFDLEIEKYIVVNFKEVQDIVDAIGGVDIEVSSHEASRLRSFGIQTPTGGTYHMMGYEAVIYMRMRKSFIEYYDEDGNLHHDTQDIGRTYRARKVLTTIAGMMSDISEDQAWEVVDTVLDNTILTNLTANDLIEIVRLAMLLKGSKVESIRMPIDGAYEQMPVAGMATQQLDWETNREALHDFLFTDDFAVRD